MIYNGENCTTSDLWNHTCEWSNTLIRCFKDAIDDYKLQQFLKVQNDHNAHIQRERARDQVMEDVDNLPREETIGNLVEKAVASKVQPLLSKFEKLLDKVGKSPNTDTALSKKMGKKGQKSTKGGNSNTQKSGNEPTKVKPHIETPSVTHNRKGKNKMGNKSNSKNGMDRKQEDGGTKKPTPSNALASSSRPHRNFRKFGSGTTSKDLAPPTQPGGCIQPDEKPLLPLILQRPTLSLYSVERVLECGITSTAIHNLSSHTLTYNERTLFIPPTKQPQTQQILDDFQSLPYDGSFDERNDGFPGFGYPTQTGNPQQSTPP